MELSGQIKKYRASMGLSQEQLAERLYVTRQTISNWENDKSYPDVHSLLMLSSLFHISLDQLIKGDIEIMKDVMKDKGNYEIGIGQEVDREEIKNMDRDSVIFSFLFVLFLVSIVPSAVFFGNKGWILSGGHLCGRNVLCSAGRKI